MRLLIFILLSTQLLQADPSIKSDIVLDNESYALKHESTYGVTNNYSTVSIEHQIRTANSFLIHYGTCVGVVIEDYAADNGFGPNAEAYGLMMQANIGVEYKLHDSQTLSFEGLLSQNQIINEAESQAKFRYQYRF